LVDYDEFFFEDTRMNIATIQLFFDTNRNLITNVKYPKTIEPKTSYKHSRKEPFGVENQMNTMSNSKPRRFFCNFVNLVHDLFLQFMLPLSLIKGLVKSQFYNQVYSTTYHIESLHFQFKFIEKQIISIKLTHLWKKSSNLVIVHVQFL